MWCITETLKPAQRLPACTVPVSSPAVDARRQAVIGDLRDSGHNDFNVDITMLPKRAICCNRHRYSDNNFCSYYVQAR